MAGKKFRSTRRFDFPYEDKRYAIGSDKDVEVEIPASGDKPARKITHYKETQEVLEYLHKLGHSGVEEVNEKLPTDKP